jgi:hypothetical protein
VWRVSHTGIRRYAQRMGSARRLNFRLGKIGLLDRRLVLVCLQPVTTHEGSYQTAACCCTFRETMQWLACHNEEGMQCLLAQLSPALV